MTEPEFSRLLPVEGIGPVARSEAIAANDAERAALAKRFDWIALDRLEAEAMISQTSAGISANGTLKASVIQACVVTGDPVPALIEAPFALRFASEEAVAEAEDERELDEDDLDVVTHDGVSIDLGEAVAQSLALSVEPYPRSAAADATLAALGPDDAGPFAGLNALLQK